MLKFFVISAIINHRREKIQQTSSLLFSIMNALSKMSCKEYVYYKWSINRVKEELNIDESEYMQLKMQIQNQMRFLQFIKWKLNINKLKEILKSTFEVIYHEFHIIFNDVARSRSDFMLMFMTQWSNYNVRRWFRVRKTQQDNLKHNFSSFFQLKIHSHLLSYVVCNEWDFKKSQSVSVRSVKILIIQISCDLNYNICCKSQDILKHESVKDLICIDDMKYDRFIKLIEIELNLQEYISVMSVNEKQHWKKCMQKNLFTFFLQFSLLQTMIVNFKFLVILNSSSWLLKKLCRMLVENMFMFKTLSIRWHNEIMS